MKHIKFQLKFSTHRIVFYKYNQNKNFHPLKYLIMKKEKSMDGGKKGGKRRMKTKAGKEYRERARYRQRERMREK